MKFTAFSLILYLIQGYVTSFQRAQLLLTGTSCGQRHRACVCARMHQSHASVTWNLRSFHLCGKSPWPVTKRPGPGAGTQRGLQPALAAVPAAPFLLSPPSPHVRDSPEVGPGVITGYLLPPYKSNRLFGLVRLKLTYQPAAVLYISLNLYLGENLWPGIAFCKMIKVAKQP